MENLKVLHEGLDRFRLVTTKPIFYQVKKMHQRLEKEIIMIGSEHFDYIRMQFPQIDTFTQEYKEKENQNITK